MGIGKFNSNNLRASWVLKYSVVELRFRMELANNFRNLNWNTQVKKSLFSDVCESITMMSLFKRIQYFKRKPHKS